MQNINDSRLIFRLAYYPDHYLHQRAELVTDFSNLQPIIDAMFDTMVLNNGIGLAANQCKLPHRIFVMRTENIRRAFINPIICWPEHSRVIENDETCLSFPGIVRKVARHPEIMVLYDTMHGSKDCVSLKGIEAICAQHEVEHLDGKTFLDNAGRMKRMIAERTVKKTLKDPTCLKQRKRI